MINTCMYACIYYMANPCALTVSFSVRMLQILQQPVYVCLGAKPANSKFANKTTKQKPVNIVILYSETTRRS